MIINKALKYAIVAGVLVFVGLFIVRSIAQTPLDESWPPKVIAGPATAPPAMVEYMRTNLLFKLPIIYEFKEDIKTNYPTVDYMKYTATNFFSTNLFIWTVGITNCYVTNTLSYASKSEKEIEEAVKLMAKEGHICKVFGHTWELGCGTEGCAVYHPELIYHCKFCKKTKEQKWEIKD